MKREDLNNIPIITTPTQFINKNGEVSQRATNKDFIAKFGEPMFDYIIGKDNVPHKYVSSFIIRIDENQFAMLKLHSKYNGLKCNFLTLAKF